MRPPVAARRRAARAYRAALAHPILAVFLVALTARVIVAVGVALAGISATTVPDSVSYTMLASQAAAGDTTSWGPHDHFVYERTRALLWPVVGLYKVFGPHELIAQLFVAMLGAATAALTAAVAAAFLPVRFAVIAGLFVALLPSEVLWSSVVLKDAVVWSMLSGLAVVVLRAGSSRGWRLVAYAAVAVGLLIGLGYTRLHTLEIALVALAVASAFGSKTWRLQRIAGAVVIAALTPLIFGMGVGGARFVAESGSLDQRRTNNAINAESAVVADPTEREAVASPGSDAVAEAPVSDPVAEAPQSGLASEIAYLPKGLVTVVMRPFPWEASESESAALKFASVETIIWYPMLLLALVGLLCIRRHLAMLAFPLLVLAGTAVMYGLTEGNLGTAYRHRGEFVWSVALLAALGLFRLLTLPWVKRHYREEATSSPSAPLV